ncbi:MAG: hypothetical protein NVSMB18_03960 [Acetobacteraceae bacterium]
MPAPPNPAPTDIDQHRRNALDELIDLGMDVARRIHHQIAAETPAEAPADHPPAKPLLALAAAFDRTARGIRRTVMLVRRLDEPALRTPDERRRAARRQIIRDVEDAIARRDPASAEADSLHAELRERLDAPDFIGDLDHRPVADIITELCRDLGLAGPPAHLAPSPWKRRTPADIAALRARAASPPSPHPKPAPRQKPGPHEPDLRLVPAPNSA